MFFVEVPVDVLLHEQVEAIVKVAPHVRVEMDPADALWVGGSSHSVQFGQKTAPAIHHHISEIFLSLNWSLHAIFDILELEELAKSVSHATQRPQVHGIHHRGVECKGLKQEWNCKSFSCLQSKR